MSFRWGGTSKKGASEHKKHNERWKDRSWSSSLKDGAGKCPGGGKSHLLPVLRTPKGQTANPLKDSRNAVQTQNQTERNNIFGEKPGRFGRAPSCVGREGTSNMSGREATGDNTGALFGVKSSGAGVGRPQRSVKRKEIRSLLIHAAVKVGLSVES